MSNKSDFLRPFALITLIILTFGQANASNHESPGVKTAPVEFKPYAKPVISSGILASKSQQKLSFKISGVVSEILVDEGNHVKKGQLLAILDQAEIKAQVKQAESVYKNALRNLKRFEKLYVEKVITQEQLQAAETNTSVALSDLNIARFNLKHSAIHAQGDGVVLRRHIERNELVSPNQSAFVISNIRQGWVIRLGITDKDIVRVNLGDKATVEFDAYKGMQFDGLVSEIGAAASQQTGLFEVELTLDPHKLPLFTGFIGKATIESQFTQHLAFIPIEALVSANQSTGSVFTVSPDGTANEQVISIAFITGGKVAVYEGLNEGDQVISEGAAYMKAGMTIKLASN